MDRARPAFVSPQPRRRLLGELLLEERLLTPPQLKQALTRKRMEGGRLGHHLMELGYLAEPDLLRVLSMQLGIPVVDLDAPGVIAPDAAGHCRPDIADQWRVCPLRFDARRRVLIVAVADPDPRVLKDIEQLLGVQVEPVLATSAAIDRALNRVFSDEAVHVTRIADLQVARSEVTRRPAPTLDEILGPPPGAEQQHTPPPSFADVAPAPTPPAPDPAVTRELAARVARLEKTVSAQARAIRTLVQMLSDRGLLKPSEPKR